MRAFVCDWETSALPAAFPWHPQAYPVLLVARIVEDDGSIGEPQYWVWRHDDCENLAPAELLRSSIQACLDTCDCIVAHNLQFDLAWLHAVGIQTIGKKLYCTALTEYLICGQLPLEYSLRATAERYQVTRKLASTEQWWASGYNTDQIPLQSILLPYAMHDVQACSEIYVKQKEKVKQLGLSSIHELSHELLRILSNMEYRGIRVDVQRAQEILDDCSQKIKDLDNKLCELLGYCINLDSPFDLSAALYGGMLKVKKTVETTRILKSGKQKTIKKKVLEELAVTGIGFKPIRGSELATPGYYSTNAKVIAGLKPKTKKQRMFLSILHERARFKKVEETLLGANGDSGILRKVVDGRIHPRFHQYATRTGRLSSSNPNSQNLPRKGTSPIKQIIVPDYDYILNADLAQLEWRVAALLCNDKTAIDEIINNVDYHTENAKKFFGDAKYRTEAKALGFRLLYGGTPYGMYLDNSLPRKPLAWWEKTVQDYYAKYYGIYKTQIKWMQEVNRHGFLISPSGRILRFQRGPNGLYSVKQVKNYPVQSFATADITPLVMVTIAKIMHQKKMQSKMMCQVHDSIVFDVPKAELHELAAICIKVFRSIPELLKQTWNIDSPVPFDGECEFGKNYGDLQPLEVTL